MGVDSLLTLLLTYLTENGVHIPAVFGYVSTRMILASVTSLIFVIFIGPLFIKKLYEMKLGQAVSRLEDVPQLKELHEKKKDTPTMGGIVILTSMLLSMLLWMQFSYEQTWLLGVTTVVLGLLGGIDDYHKLRKGSTTGLTSKQKFLVQCFVAIGISLWMAWEFGWWRIPYFIPLVKTPLLVPGIMGVVFFLFASSFIVVGSSNAVNLSDGLDGLASGLAVLVASVLGVFAFLTNNAVIAEYLNILYVDGSGEVAVYMASLFGACLGFLWYNGHPAQVFMGDTGSLALGGVLGVAAILLRRELVFAIASGVFVIETVSVILQVLSYRYRNKKRIFLCAPLHHHFEKKGWPETKVVLRFWIVGLLLALVALGTIKFQ